jgi:hypothetical protein
LCGRDIGRLEGDTLWGVVRPWPGQRMQAGVFNLGKGWGLSETHSCVRGAPHGAGTRRHRHGEAAWRGKQARQATYSCPAAAAQLSGRHSSVRRGPSCRLASCVDASDSAAAGPLLARMPLHTLHTLHTTWAALSSPPIALHRSCVRGAPPARRIQKPGRVK